MASIWIIYSFLSMICIATLTLIQTKLTKIETSSILINLYLFAFTLIGFFVLALREGKFAVSKVAVIWLIASAVVAVGANYFMVEAIRLSPNPGYPWAIASFNLVIVTIASIFLFSSDFTVNKFIGILIVLLGVVVLSVF